MEEIPPQPVIDQPSVPATTVAQIAEVEKETEIPVPKKHKRGRWGMLGGGIIGVLLIAIIIVLLFPKKKTSVVVHITPSPTMRILPVAPTSTISAALLPTATTIPEQVLWAAYPSTGSLGDSGISFAYPKGWTVNYRKVIDPLTVTPYTRFEFDFLPTQVTPLPTPSDWMGWGTMVIDVYPRMSDPKSWVAAYMPELIDKFTMNTDTRILQGYLYIITPSKDTNMTDQYLVFGSNHSFHITFGHPENPDAIRRIKKEIWPQLSLQ